MIMTMSLLGMPYEKFKDLVLNYSQWIQEINKSVFLYIEMNRITVQQAEEIVQILQKKSLIDVEKVNRLLNECYCDSEIKERLKALYVEEQEKEWIVYYVGRDVGHRVKAKNYTDALLVAYVQYGSDGKITKVEEVNK